jgi:hypothetical protein
VVLRRFAAGTTFELPIGDKPGRCNGNPRAGIDIAVDASKLRDALQRAGGEAAPTPFRIGGVAAGQACGKDGRVIWTF